MKIETLKKPTIIKVGKTHYEDRSVYRFTYSKLFWIFFIACFLGVVFETAWCLIMRHRYESRVGVIYGPFNPVYGFGAVLLTVILKRLSNKRDLWVFLFSMVIGGSFEYICSFVQEIALGTVSWEYSHTQFNLNGRTNLMYSFFWGILGLLWVKELFPRLSSLLDRIPARINKWLTVILSAFMLFNMLISLLALERQSQRRVEAKPANAIARFLDKQYPDEFLKKKYPNMMTVTDQDKK
ncbi:MAG: putative ABC transporter permease [Oscillospiraceae bacterium]|nr:putative ABC transporter permease [Oscillospiraceae bacterium]